VLILLKYINIYLKVLRHVSILRDHLQGVCLYLAKVAGLFTNLRSFKFLNTEFKIPMVSSGVVAAIHVAGVRCGPCGAKRWTEQSNALHHKGHNALLLHVLLPQRRS